MALILPLLGLALVDSTSIGTLVLPLLMVVIAGRADWGSLAIYFRTVVGLYFAIGVALLLGAGAVVEVLGDVLDTAPVYWLLLILGVGLFIQAFRMEGKDADPERLKGMVRRGSKPGALVGLALASVGTEVATMLPYLGAIGLLSTSDWSWPVQIGALVVYCLVMILPAVLIIGVASLFGDRLWGRLERFSTWIARQTEETIAWIVGIVGFYMAGFAVGQLGLL